MRATGLDVQGWHDLILVNQLGQRFYDETKGDYPNGNVYNDVKPYTLGDYRNNASIHQDPTTYNFFNAVCGDECGVGAARLLGGSNMGHLRCRRGGTGAVASHSAVRGIPDGYFFTGVWRIL